MGARTMSRRRRRSASGERRVVGARFCLARRVPPGDTSKPRCRSHTGPSSSRAASFGLQLTGYRLRRHVSLGDFVPRTSLHAAARATLRRLSQRDARNPRRMEALSDETHSLSRVDCRRIDNAWLGGWKLAGVTAGLRAGHRLPTGRNDRRMPARLRPGVGGTWRPGGKDAHADLLLRVPWWWASAAVLIGQDWRVDQKVTGIAQAGPQGPT